MDKQLLEQDFYRWVKASERLPKIRYNYHAKVRGFNNSIYNDAVLFDPEKIYNTGRGGSNWDTNDEVIAWLEKVEAGATSSSTVKNLERENSDLKKSLLEGLRIEGELKREVERLKGLDNSWPLNDVLHELKEAARTLLDKHNYDGTRHEEILHCIKRAEEIQQSITKTVNNDRE